MAIKNYSDLNSLELDTLKEIGSIGTGNAATALSSLIGQQVRIEMPEVRIMGYNEAIEWIGGPRGDHSRRIGQDERAGEWDHALRTAAGICQSGAGEYVGKGVEDYSGLHEMECSAPN